MVSKPRSGIYAINPHEIRSSLQKNDNSDHPLADLQPSIRTHTLQNYLIDFNPSGVDKDMFPVRTWEKNVHSVLENNSENICQYGDPQGEYGLRSVLTDYLRNARGVVCSPEQIVIGSGILYSIGVLTELLKGIQHVAFEEPGFGPVREQFIRRGYQLIPVSVHDKGISLEELENSEAQIVYVTPSHQFPTGSVIPYAEREYLLSLGEFKKCLHH